MWIIKSRYQYYHRDGIKWTDWFNSMWDTYGDENKAKERLKDIVEKTKSIDKSTKLKHEFKLEEI